MTRTELRLTSKGIETDARAHAFSNVYASWQPGKAGRLRND